MKSKWCSLELVTCSGFNTTVGVTWLCVNTCTGLGESDFTGWGIRWNAPSVFCSRFWQVAISDSQNASFGHVPTTRAAPWQLHKMHSEYSANRFSNKCYFLSEMEKRMKNVLPFRNTFFLTYSSPYWTLHWGKRKISFLPVTSIWMYWDNKIVN